MENCHSFPLHVTGYHFTATHGCHANTDSTPKCYLVEIKNP